MTRQHSASTSRHADDAATPGICMQLRDLSADEEELLREIATEAVRFYGDPMSVALAAARCSWTRARLNFSRSSVSLAIGELPQASVANDAAVSPSRTAQG